MNNTNKLMIYGAAGYSGRLAVAEAVQQGLKPVLAGRGGNVRELAKIYGLEYRIFNLENPFLINKNLGDISVLVNMAGPFSKTMKHLVSSCLHTRGNYIDINGKASEFEELRNLDEEAKRCGSMLMPGVGFGVVPTDLMGLYLKNKLPDATKLTLAFITNGDVSQGTVKSMFKDFLTEGVTRSNDALVPMLPAKEKLKIEAEGKKYTVVTNPHRGDLVTVYETTKVPTIELYSNYPRPLVWMMRYGRVLQPLMNHSIVQTLLSLLPEGPNAKQLAKGKTYIYGKIENGTESHEALMSGPEAYVFSTYATIAVAKRAFENQYTPGFQTPAGLYGLDLLKNLPGVTIKDL
jgi:short subunit dehydrogenase-like uncharacterized protein